MISRNKATISIRLAHESKKRKDGTLSILLRITYCRKSKYISLGYTATKKDFEKMYNGNVRGELKELRIRLQSIESKANDIINSLDSFSFSGFEAKLFRPHSSQNNVFQYLRNEVNYAGSIKSKGVAIGSIKSFHNYSKRNDLTFEDISVSWLKGYEKYMLSHGKSPTTVGIYLRTLRVAYNKAISEGIAFKELYPFGKGRYVIPESRNIKKAIDRNDLSKLLHYNPRIGSKEHWAMDMWLFIFLCNGINPKDVAFLKYRNLDSDSITFLRAKTSNTRKLQKPIVVPIDDKVNQIIHKWGS